jgi:hypothetical protein
MKVIAEGTFVLNLETASSSTYQTWVTVRLMADRTLQRKSNAKGNGQTWTVFGYVTDTEVKLFSTHANETQQAKILAHCCYLSAERCNVKGYGAAWSKATWVKPTVSTQTGRKLTSAPSIRLGRVERDKNVNTMRRKVETIDMAAAMRRRNGKTYRIDPCTLRITG